MNWFESRRELAPVNEASGAAWGELPIAPSVSSGD
jgi:hypothetical protein